jgi:hypothetical protein
LNYYLIVLPFSKTKQKTVNLLFKIKCQVTYTRQQRAKSTVRPRDEAELFLVGALATGTNGEGANGLHAGREGSFFHKALFVPQLMLETACAVWYNAATILIHKLRYPFQEGDRGKNIRSNR